MVSEVENPSLEPRWRCANCGTENRSTFADKRACPVCGLRPISESPKVVGNPSGLATDISGRTKFGRISGLLPALSWLNAIAVLSLLCLVRWVGASFYGTSLLLMMPRAFILLPTITLAIASGLLKRRSLWIPQAATAIAVIGPFMGLSLPIWQVWHRPAAGETVRLVSFNMGSEPIDRERWLAWLTSENVDVILLQEPFQHKKWLAGELRKRGWTLNGANTVATRFKIVEELEPLADHSRHGERYSGRLHRSRLETSGGRRFVVASVHLPTLRFGFEGFMKTKETSVLLDHDQWWALQLSRALSLIAETADEPMLIGGDFNLPSDDSRLSALRDSFRFAFDEAGWGYGYTRPSRFPWVRIDHLLGSPEWSVTRCFVGPDFGSDHLPTFAEFLLPNAVPGM